MDDLKIPANFVPRFMDNISNRSNPKNPDILIFRSLVVDSDNNGCRLSTLSRKKLLTILSDPSRLSDIKDLILDKKYDPKIVIERYRSLQLDIYNNNSSSTPAIITATPEVNPVAVEVTPPTGLPNTDPQAEDRLRLLKTGVNLDISIAHAETAAAY